MNKLSELLTPKILLLVLTVIILFGVILTATSIVVTIIDNQLYSHEFCFSAGCVEYFVQKTKGSCLFLSWAGKASAGVGTMLAVIIGLMSYQSGQKSSYLTNNISQYEHFSRYLEKLQSGYPRINLGSINSLYWYKLMHVDTSKNEFSISDDYKKLMRDINSCIIEAQRLYEAGGGNYKYKQHQHNIIDLFLKVGISIEHGPRTEFSDTRSQVISLVNNVNALFVADSEGIVISQGSFH